VDLELISAEVVDLWTFVHRDVMEGAVRQLLRAGLGWYQSPSCTGANQLAA
jgi:hypothetical protein